MSSAEGRKSVDAEAVLDSVGTGGSDGLIAGMSRILCAMSSAEGRESVDAAVLDSVGTGGSDGLIAESEIRSWSIA